MIWGRDTEGENTLCSISYIWLLGAIKSKEKPIIAQTLGLMVALGLVTTAILLRPKSLLILAADLFGCAAAVFLPAPAVEAVRKQWQAKQEASEGAKS